jgi:hypothetical protein
MLAYQQNGNQKDQHNSFKLRKNPNSSVAKSNFQDNVILKINAFTRPFQKKSQQLQSSPLPERPKRQPEKPL